MGLSSLVSKVKNHHLSGLPAADPALSGNLTKRQLYQTRYNFGVNFGGSFIGEKWIYSETFPDGAACELEAVTKSIEQDAKKAKETFENHWKNYASDDDWKWLADHGVNCVRVPIGYWEVGGGQFTKGTKFESVKDVYSNAWEIFKKVYVEPAALHNIGIIVDLQGLPGGANGQDHSGEKATGKAEFWDSSSYQKTAVLALQFIAKDLKEYENIAAIEIVNEAEFSNSGSKQKAYYGAAIKAIRAEDKTVPIIISDGWWPDQWVKWVQENQDSGLSLGVVIDHHCYRCFDDKDRAKSAEQITDDLEGDLLTNLTDGGAGVDIIVCEWTCCMDNKSFENSGLPPQDYGNPKRAELASKFGARQAELLFQRAGAGALFWTYKFQSGSGGEWDFREQVGKAFNAPRVNVPGNFEDALNSNFGAHKDYWNGQNSNEKYDHDRYKDGFTTAWKDGEAFAKQGSLVGRRQAVKIARLQEHIKNKGKSDFLWEWEQGYDKGTEEFARAARG